MPAAADRCKVPHAFWRAVEQFGVPPAELARQARLPAALHLGGQTFLATTSQYFALMRALEELSGDSTLGLRMVQGVDTAAHPPATLAAFYGRDFRDGLARLARFKRLCTPELLQVAETKGEGVVSVDWPFAAEREPAISVDITFATVVELGRRGTRRAIAPKRIELARPGPVSAFHREYFNCPIRTGATRDRLILHASDLARPFPGHNPEVLDILTTALGAALADLEGPSSVCARVKVVLKRSLASGQPSVSEVARELAMSGRTLQRRITEEGETFRGLLSQARHELGCRLLTDPATDIAEVACLLGYQDTTSFYRAFHDWEGEPPNQWRERHVRGVPSAVAIQ